jgi:CRP-like cAMP-binding protein
LRLIRRIRDADEDEETDLPTSVEAIQLLKTVPLFAELSPSQLAELAEAVSWTTSAAGGRADDGEDALFVVQSGKVTIADADTKVFGERALLGGEPVPAAITVEKARILRLAREDFERICNDTPGIALAICRVLARR